MKTFSALLAFCAGNSPVSCEFPHKGHWRGALTFSLICVWINGWVNNRDAGDLRCYRAHDDVTVMCEKFIHGLASSHMFWKKTNAPQIPHRLASKWPMRSREISRHFRCYDYRRKHRGKWHKIIISRCQPGLLISFRNTNLYFLKAFIITVAALYTMQLAVFLIYIYMHTYCIGENSWKTRCFENIQLTTLIISPK